MPKIISFFLCFFLFSGLFAQEASNGIQFFQGTWAEALEKAEKEQKLVFVDAFADWCGPCKMMAANVFPNKDVGEYFSEKFISYKFDMEKGEGPAFAKKYTVMYYPTFFILDAKGEVVDKKSGAMSADSFLSWSKKVVTKKEKRS